MIYVSSNTTLVRRRGLPVPNPRSPGYSHLTSYVPPGTHAPTPYRASGLITYTCRKVDFFNVVEPCVQVVVLMSVHPLAFWSSRDRRRHSDLSYLGSCPGQALSATQRSQVGEHHDWCAAGVFSPCSMMEILPGPMRPVPSMP